MAGSNVARWLPPLEGPYGCGLFASSEAQQAQQAQPTFQTGLGLDSSVTWETDGNSTDSGGKTQLWETLGKNRNVIDPPWCFHISITVSLY